MAGGRLTDAEYFWRQLLRLADLSDDCLMQLPRIDENLLRVLWHNEYWDGPRSGVLLYSAQPHWFQIYGEDDSGRWKDWYGKFLVIQLSEAQYAEEAANHRLFHEKVGLHTDYDSDGRPVQGSQKPQEMWHEYYDEAKKRPELDLSNNEVVGRFEWLWGTAGAMPKAAT